MVYILQHKQSYIKLQSEPRKKQGVKKCHVQSQGVGMAVAAKRWQRWLCVTVTVCSCFIQFNFISSHLISFHFRGASPLEGEQGWAVINSSSMKQCRGAFEAHTCPSGVRRVGRGSGPSTGLGYHRVPAPATCSFWRLKSRKNITNAGKNSGFLAAF